MLMLAKVVEKRLKGYERLGYTLCRSTENSTLNTEIVEAK
jgi:hypothetical protein